MSAGGEAVPLMLLAPKIGWLNFSERIPRSSTSICRSVVFFGMNIIRCVVRKRAPVDLVFELGTPGPEADI